MYKGRESLAHNTIPRNDSMALIPREHYTYEGRESLAHNLITRNDSMALIPGVHCVHG